MTLTIPDIADDADMLTAALAYADAGWYTLPVAAGTKDPGSVVGKGWPAKSSRDAKQIAAWFAGTDHGIALHAGRSGAVILDVDEPDNVPDEVLCVMESDAPHQSSRPQPGRGHYLVANTTGRRIGNSLGKLASATKWGEVRGANGVIIAAPTPHPEGGHYRWIRTGPVPPIPDFLAEALPESSTPDDTATDTEIEHFLNTHTENTKPEALAGLTNALRTKLAGKQSCHMSTLGVLTDAMQEAAAGYYSARTATRTLYPLYLDTVTTGTSTGRVLTKAEAKHSYKGIVAWAVGQAEAGAARARDRVNTKYRDTVIEICAEDIHAPPTTGILEKLEGDFWTRRECHRLIYDAALSKMCSPWAVLACVTARTLALIPPSVTLPAVIGGIGSLNWFAAIVAKSGGGKGAANAVAAALVPGAVYTRGAGSGEGMVEAYERRQEPQDHVTAILFSVDEVDSLASLQARSGQTTMSVIRSGFSGETLGFSYRGRSKEIVEAHSYRMTMIVSVQPERAAGLFDDAGGGTQQRFMWFPGRDRRIKAATAPPWPDVAGLPRQLPEIDTKKLPHRGIDIPREAKRLILEAREQSMNGNDDALDGHALFCREKFAYALALFDGRTAMNDEDWELSGRAADVSDWCRLRAQKTLEESRRAAAIERGHLRGVESYESDISKAVIASDEQKRILAWAVGKLRRAPDTRLTKRDLSRAASSRDRAKLNDSMLRGVEAGLIKADGVEWVLL